MTSLSLTRIPCVFVIACWAFMVLCPTLISAQAITPAPLSGGPVVAHVDSATAVLSFWGTNSTRQTGGLLMYWMTIPKSSRGQWMGERATPKKAGSPGTRIRVGQLSAEQLVSAWRRFRYSAKEQVRSTLTWSDCCGKTQAAKVHVIGKPKRTSRGVTFAMTSDKPLDLNIKNISLHLIRAGQSRNAFTPYAGVIRSSMTAIPKQASTQITTIVDTLTLSQTNTTSSEVKVNLYGANVSAPACWEVGAENVPGMKDDQRYWRVDPVTCANVTAMSANESATGELWGALLERDGSSQTAWVTVSLLITPPGANPYTYTHQFDSWSYE